MNNKLNLLLLSNSTKAGGPYLGWPKQHIFNFLNGIEKLLFIPYAGVTISMDEYTQAVATVLEPKGIEVQSIYKTKDPAVAVLNAPAIAIGGGNTFRLIEMLHKNGLIPAIRKAALEGIPLVGWSAGTNVCCPNISTTNDMPIIRPPSFEALGLIDFQINPHYTEKTIEGHGGESRNQRLLEYLEINQEVTIAGLPECTCLQIRDGILSFHGDELYVFNYGKEKRIIRGSAELDASLNVIRRI